MLSEREAEREERRANNQIWTAARDYSLHSEYHAYNGDGTADVYMNSIIGAAYQCCDFGKLKELFQSFTRTAKGPEYEELVWIALENYAYERSKAERPALPGLRRQYARELVDGAARQERDMEETERLKLGHYRRALGEGMALTEREKKMLDALELPPELTEAEVVERLRDFFSVYYSFVPTVTARGSRSWLRHIRLGRRRNTLGATVRSEDDEEGSKGDKRVRGRMSGERTEPEMREYLEEFFGPSMYGAGDLHRIEERLCTGNHWDCMLHFTRGGVAAGKLKNREALVQRSAARRQAEANRKYYMDDIIRNRLTIARLAEKIRNCILVHLDDARIKSRAGELRPGWLWRAIYLNEDTVFTRPERGTDTELTVDILLDASASQIQRQESVASQAYIIAESLTRCGIPTRVYSFCTINGCTVLRIYRDYDEDRKNEAVFEYCSAGWNRDGLAIRAAGYMMRGSRGERRILMILSDASPNDDRKLVSAGKKEDYNGLPGVMDTAAEVEKLRRQGVSVMCVFTGEEEDLPNARRIYGRDLVRIRSIEQFADAVGNVLTGLIGSM